MIGRSMCLNACPPGSAESFARDIRLLCLDELEVTDIVDAIHPAGAILRRGALRPSACIARARHARRHGPISLDQCRRQFRVDEQHSAHLRADGRQAAAESRRNGFDLLPGRPPAALRQPELPAAGPSSCCSSFPSEQTNIARQAASMFIVWEGISEKKRIGGRSAGTPLGRPAGVCANRSCR